MKIRAIAALLFILISVSAFGEGRIKITGYVRDADGNPLELVNVRVKNTLIGSMTNEKGYYSFSISPGDSISVIYSCLGYNKAERIIPSAQADMRLNVQMNNTSFDLGEVSVTAIRKQTTTMESLNADKIKLLPDPSGGSIESLVVTFAGVSSNNELSSQYSVRGGSYDENIVYVNGIEVFRPLLIRSGQQEGLSFINPDLTEAVNFAAGGFEARYGDKMSSVLDITYKKPKIFEGSASASLLGANAYVGSSIGKFTQVDEFVTDDFSVFIKPHTGYITFGHFKVAGTFGFGSEHGSNLTSHAFTQVFEAGPDGKSPFRESALATTVNDLQEEFAHGRVDSITNEIRVQGFQ